MVPLPTFKQLIFGGFLVSKWPSSREAERRLTFKADSTFNLIVFSDLHLGERNGDGSWAAWGEEQDRKSRKTMERALVEENEIDFVVYNGDQVTGENLWLANGTSYLATALEPTVAHNLPFASVYGNHDHSTNISHSQLYDYEKTHHFELSRTRRTPSSSLDPEGSFNYYVPVFASKADKTPSLLLWMFDSRGGIFDSPSKYEDWVDSGVANWIEQTSSGLREAYGGFLPPSLAFVHIPPETTRTIQAEVVTHNKLWPGLNDDNPLDYQGSNHPELIKPDLPFWQALTSSLGKEDGGNGGLIATVVGHNHGNDWCAMSETVPFRVCFARHTGYGGYGHRPKGSRVFQFTKSDDSLAVKSWIRMEDGTIANTTVLRG